MLATLAGLHSCMVHCRAEFWREVGGTRFLRLLEGMAQNRNREACVRDRVCMLIQVRVECDV